MDDFDGNDSDANQKKEMLVVSAIPLHLRTTASTSATSMISNGGGHRGEFKGFVSDELCFNKFYVSLQRKSGDNDRQKFNRFRNSTMTKLRNGIVQS